MGYIEVTAKTVDEAITRASIQLETSSDLLDIKVISEGSSGFLGIGSKPAIIKVCKKSELPEKETEVYESVDIPENKIDMSENTDTTVRPVQAKTGTEPSKREEKKPVKRSSIADDNKKQEAGGTERPESAPIKREEIKPKTEEEIELMKKTAGDFLQQVFEAMQMKVSMDMEYDQNEGSLNIDFSGDEMGILIGKRGQTLDSLQYLTSLVANKNQENYGRVKLDTENYRKRRKETLENLSKNIAYKVKKTRRPVSLEPMNPYERRIIHSALQYNKFVETYSEGTEPYRHVVVALKK